MFEPFGNFREGGSILLVNFALQGLKKHALSGIYLVCYVDVRRRSFPDRVLDLAIRILHAFANSIARVDERGSHPIKT